MINFGNGFYSFLSNVKTMDEGEQSKNNIIDTLELMADKIEKSRTNVCIPRLVDNFGSTIGGAMTISVLALAPFTFGASISLLVANLSLNFLGTSTSLGSVIANHYLDKIDLKKAKMLI